MGRTRNFQKINIRKLMTDEQLVDFISLIYLKIKQTYFFNSFLCLMYQGIAM